MLSDEIGERAAKEMAAFYQMRARYRERKTKRGKERLDAKARKVGNLLRKSIETYKLESGKRVE